MFCKKGVLTNFTKLTGKHLCQSLLFNKVAGLRPATLLKKRLWHRCFPVNFVKFLRTPFFIERLWWLLLIFHVSTAYNIIVTFKGNFFRIIFPRSSQVFVSCVLCGLLSKTILSQTVTYKILICLTNRLVHLAFPVGQIKSAT